MTNNIKYQISLFDRKLAQSKQIKNNILEILDPWKELFQKPLVRILILVVLLLVVVFTSIEITKSPHTNRFGPLVYPQDQMVVGEKMPAVKVSFSFPSKTKIPDSVSVYKIETGGEDKNSALFDNISRSLGATVSAETKIWGNEKMHSVTQDNFYFAGNLSTGYFSFSGKSAKTLDTTDEDSIKLSAWGFLSLLGITSHVSNAPTVFYYNYLGGEPVVSKNALLSDVASLSYSPTVNSIPLIGLGSTETSLRITVDRKNKNIVGLVFAIPAVDTKTQGSYSVLSLVDISRATPGGVSILDLTDKNGEKIANQTAGDMVSINFNHISLAYYVTPEIQGLLQPIFLLKGDALLKDNRSGTITAILPAVKNIK